jgi:iron complex outermembrane recepter protein
MVQGSRLAGYLLSGVAGITLFAAPALAQQAGTAAATDPVPSGDIVVTATRQQSTVNKVPLSITAFSKDALDARGVREVDDVFRMTPGVTFQQDITGGSSISIRGIASDSGAATTGIYIDDAPIQTRAIGFTSTPIYPVTFDLDRVEVLRGPQGTLFGAGSEGGTVRFITTQPSLSGLGIYGRAEAASTKDGAASYEAGVAVNIPLSDKIAVRFMAYNRHDGGYIDHANRQTGVIEDTDSDWMDTNAFRISALFQPIDQLKIVASFNYQHQYQNDAQAYTEYVSDPSKGVFINNSNATSPFWATWRMPSLNVTYDFDKLTLTANGSYFDQTNQIDRDYSDFLATLLGGTVTPQTGIAGDPTYYNQTYYLHSQQVWTGEVRLASHYTGWFNFVIGGFYQHEKQYEGEFLPEQSQAAFDQFVEAYLGIPGSGLGGGQLVNGVYSYISQLNTVDAQKALFGEATLQPVDHVKIILGGRYTHSSFVSDTHAFGPYAGAPETSASGAETENKFLPKAGIQYDFNDSNRVYFTASKGFRPGGAQNQLAARCAGDLATLGYDSAPSSFGPDEVWSYEVGSKNRFFGNKLSVNASAYRIDWTAIQESIYLPNCGGNIISNLGHARSQGFDIDAEIHPMRGLLFQFSAGYDKATYTESILAPANAEGVQAVIVNKGDSLGNPPWQFTAASQYNFTAFRHDLYARGDWQFTARETIPTIARDPATSSYSPTYIPQPTQNYVTLRIGMKTGPMDISAFANNLFNDTPVLAHLQYGGQANLINLDRTLRPRTIGLTMTYRQ